MQNQRSKVKKNTIKIGYFVRQFRKSVSILYFKGVYQACLDNNATLIIGTAGEHFDEIKESYDSDIEFFKLNLFNKNYFDGIIARTSSLNYCFNNDINELKIFLEKFKPLPIVNIGLPVFDYPTLVTENIISTKKIMEHLIIDHGYRHIAFVKGGYNHFSGEERFKTYLETLSQYNIPINYDLISPQCYYSEYSAIKAFDFFNEKFKKNILIPGKNIQAIVTTSDVHAIPLIKMLKNAGIKVPEEIAITGFNNSNESQFTDPDITTVDQDFFQIGYRAVEILLHMIKFKEVPKFNPYIPVKIIIRKSCGCKDLSINNVTDKKNIITITKENFKTVFYNIFSHSINDKFNKLNYYNSKFLSKEILSELFNCFINDIINDNSETFLLNFSNIVLFNNEDNYEYLIFQKFFTDLWNLLNYNYADNNLKNKTKFCKNFIFKY